MPQWIEDRAERLMDKNPEMSKSKAFAIATQQSHALGKSPKGYGTKEGKKKAKKKYSTPDDDQKTASLRPTLFLSLPKLGITSEEEHKKIAGMPSMVSEDPGKWTQEITAEVYRTFPFLDGFDIRPEIVKADPDTGVGTGRVVIRHPALRPGMEAPDGPTLILPFVIRGLEMAPLDLATDGNVYFPASQQRMERVLMNPALTSVGPQAEQLVDDTSYFTDLIPPGRSMHGAYPGMSQVKVGSVQESGDLITQLMNMEKLSHFTDPVLELRDQLSKNKDYLTVFSAVTPELVEKVASYQPKTIELQDVLKELPPSTLQFEKISSHRVRVTYANRQAFEKVAEDVPASQAEQYMPEGGAEQMQEQGFATMPTEGPVVIPNLPRLDPTSPIVYTGDYTVFQRDGSKLNGWATPNVVDFDQTPRGMVVFSNGSVCALQQQIAGIQTGTGLVPPTTHKPQGMGFFLFKLDGDYQAYGPVMIQSSGQMPDGGLIYNCVDAITGMPTILQPTPGLERVAAMGEGMYGIPLNIEFLPCDMPTDVLMSGEILKTAGANRGNEIVLSSAGADSFNIQGDPVAALDFEQKHDLTKKAAHFLLVTCGVAPGHAMEMLKEATASMGEHISAFGAHIIHSKDDAKEVLASVRNIHVENTPPAWDLLKEAAHIALYLHRPERKNGPAMLGPAFQELFKLASPSLPNQETVDSILSLGMINPQTVSTFLRQKPDLEKSLSTLCSLLLYTRLGAPGIPELALERTIEGLDQTLEGLDMLPFNVQES